MVVMDQKNQRFEWWFTARETFAIVGTVVSVLLFSFQTFQSKEAAAVDKAYLAGRMADDKALLFKRISEVEERQGIRIDKLESQVSDIAKGVNEVAKDTNYIRGKLEPRR
jgi:hypothetical protein